MALVWQHQTTFVAYKRIVALQSSNASIANAKTNSYPVVTKYDGKILIPAIYTNGDQAYIDNNSLNITIFDTDTGLDHAYIPIATELSAFISFGWKVNGYTAGTTITAEASPLVAAAGTYTLLHAGLYKSVTVTKSTDNVTFVAATEGTDYTVNFSGTAVFTNNTAGGLYYKITYTYGVVANSWVSVVDGTTAPSTNTIAFVSANQATNYTPYSLSYQLAVSTEEIVNVEGSIGLHSGGNLIEALEGVIDREPVTPVWGGSGDNFYYINNPSLSTSLLKNRTIRYIGVYRNGVLDRRWFQGASLVSSGYTQKIAASDFDATAVYTVTYVALDKYLLTTNVTNVNIDYSPNIAGAVAKNVQSIADIAQNFGRVDNRLSQTLLFGITTNSGNVYAATITPISAYYTGLVVRLMVNANASGAVTLNINGLGAKNVKTSQSAAVANWKANAIVTVVYNGTDFISQGEGSDGTALAGDILIGKTATVLNGDITGTMPNQTGQGPNSTSTLGASYANLIYLQPPLGYYNGSEYVHAYDANWLAANIPNGMSMFGLVGTGAAARRFASGSGSSNGSGVFTVTGLSFKPRQVILTETSTTSYYAFIAVFSSTNTFWFYNSNANYGLIFYQTTGGPDGMNQISTDLTTSTGFSITGLENSHGYKWEAYD